MAHFCLFDMVQFLVPYKSKGAFIITPLYTVTLKSICNFYQEGNVPMISIEKYTHMGEYNNGILVDFWINICLFNKKI